MYQAIKTFPPKDVPGGAFFLDAIKQPLRETFRDGGGIIFVTGRSQDIKQTSKLLIETPSIFSPPGTARQPPQVAVFTNRPSDFSYCEPKSILEGPIRRGGWQAQFRGRFHPPDPRHGFIGEIGSNESVELALDAARLNRIVIATVSEDTVERVFSRMENQLNLKSGLLKVPFAIFFQTEVPSLGLDANEVDTELNPDLRPLLLSLIDPHRVGASSFRWRKSHGVFSSRPIFDCWFHKPEAPSGELSAWLRSMPGTTMVPIPEIRAYVSRLSHLAWLTLNGQIDAKKFNQIACESIGVRRILGILKKQFATASPAPPIACLKSGFWKTKTEED